MSIHEKDFPDLGSQTFEIFRRIINARRLGCATDDLAKIVEILDRSEALSLQNDFAFEIMNVIEGMPVAVRA